MPAERPNERRARRIVAQALGCEVRRFEDESANAQVDAEILLPGGAAGMEIVADHDPAEMSQWNALAKLNHEVPVPQLQLRWIVTLRRSAKVKNAAKELPRLMPMLERGEIQWPRRGAPPEFERIGVDDAIPITNDDRPGGRVHLMAEGRSGSAGTSNLAPWIASMFDRHPDVSRKLNAHPTEHGHAFLWATGATDFDVQFALEDRGQALPREAPFLPIGVTHVWVGGGMSSQGTLAWFPDRGWWRTSWQWPASKEELRRL
jgi:hypothetical protein